MTGIRLRQIFILPRCGLGTRLRLAEAFIHERKQQKLFALAQDQVQTKPRREGGL